MSMADGWSMVSTDGAIEAGGNMVEDIVQLDKYKSITTDILIFEPLTKEQLIMLGEWLLSYNEPIKTVSVMAWVAGCFIKPHLKKSGIKFPHLLLVGEQGSGKSNTLERVILPVFSCSKNPRGYAGYCIYTDEGICIIESDTTVDG